MSKTITVAWLHLKIVAFRALLQGTRPVLIRSAVVQQQSPLLVFSLFCAVLCTVKFIPHISAVFLSTLVTLQLVKKRPNEIQSNLSVGGGLFHWQSLLTFYTAQHQKVSFIERLRWLIFKLVHFMKYKPRKYFKTDTLPKVFKLQG